MPTYLFHTAENLQYIRESWGDLQALRYPGTARPWRQLFLTPEQREASNRSAAAERAERYVPRTAAGLQWLAAEPQTAAGAAPSPALDDVLDVIAYAEKTVFWLEDQARDLLGFSRTCTRCRHEAEAHPRNEGGYPCTLCGCHDYRVGAFTRGEPTTSQTMHAPFALATDAAQPWRRDFTPADREWVAIPAASGALHWSCSWLESSLDVISAHEDFADVLTEDVRHVRRRIAAVVGDVENGMTLKAYCISCRGVDATSSLPSYTLRLRVAPAPVIECSNPDCEPTDAMCGNWIRGRPAWPQHEWDWLANRIRESEALTEA